MRASVRFALVVPVMLLAARTPALLPQCPGIQEIDNETTVHLLGAGSCAESGCAGGPGSLLAALAEPLCDFGVLPGECGRCECCRQRTVDLFAGTDLELVGPNPGDFCGIGNRGRPMGEAALCLQAQPERISNPLRSP